ncbi:MAG TPA: protein kinase [Blastocatellia bacterium]|nr:protein kinase [Blastocatellia bacterium]
MKRSECESWKRNEGRHYRLLADRFSRGALLTGDLAINGPAALESSSRPYRSVDHCGVAIDQMLKETISHYQILNKLGEGGMGEVYLAQDPRLGRQVAIKLLPASYQYDPDRRARFLKEARSASALRSPNIAAIYDIGEHDGAMFIVMEYVEGDVLSRRIERALLSTREVVDIATQVSDALDEAHTLGIIHRDVKSSNLILSQRGMVKMLDFGLAKIVEPGAPSDSSELTVSLGQQTAYGTVMGTVSYMSPEQALGQRLDHRTDIFSLGVVMYEMLTGRLPFGGGSANEIIDNIVHSEPVAIARFNYSVPEELERIVRKCMEKESTRRYQHTRELSTDLRNLIRDIDSGAGTDPNTVRKTQPTRRGRSRKTIDSLAVLPLINATDDPDTEYLSDGITESIINNLSQLPKLRVMARSTVFRYKGRDIDGKQVGHELGVRAVLTGRVLQRGEQLIIKTELVDTIDGSLLWGEQYNRLFEDIFTVEEEISREISEQLRLKLSGAQKKRLTRRYTENTEAYQHYLKGRFHWNKRTEEAMKRGIEYFQQAIEIDPGYALAYAGLADSFNLLASYSMLASSDAFPRAKAAATRALELDEGLAEAHTSMAFVKFGYDWDWKEAERGFNRAIELNPNYPMAHQWNAVTLVALGRFEESFTHAKRAQELDPLSLPISTLVGWLRHLARDYDGAIAQYKSTIELDAGFALAHRRLGQTYEQTQMYAEALDAFQKAEELAGEDVELMSARGHLYGVLGESEKAEAALEKLKATSKRKYVPAYLVARAYAGMGKTDLVFEWLEKAYEERYGYLAYLNIEPLFDSLRTDPRFIDLVHRVGLD